MNLEAEIQKLHERNRQVEAAKAWETSWFRRVFLMVFTYAAAFLFMWIAEMERAWLAAMVPALAYFLSTLGLPPLRKWWIRTFYKN